MEYELILRRAKLYKTPIGHKPMDVGIAKGKIAAIEESIAAKGQDELQCDDLMVVPGLIDLHVHAAYSLNKNSLLPDDIGVRTGVTTVVDVGSVGAFLAEAFCDHVVKTSTTRVLGFLNIALATGHPLTGMVDPNNVDLSFTLKELQRNPEVFRGIKIMASVSKLGLFGIEAVKVAKKASSLSGLPLMVHIGNPPPIIEDILGLLREGDVVTHCFHGKPGGLLDRQGKVIPEAWEALDRGVKFDIGHGSSSFNFDVYRKATMCGFPFHVISSDLHVKNRKGPVFDLVTTMNKFLALGCTVDSVIEATTASPAEILGEKAILRVGETADLSILKLTTGQFTYVDAERNQIEGRERLEACHTVRNGKLVWSRQV